MAFQLHHHNRLEHLAALAGAQIHDLQRQAPLQPVICIVPQPAVGSWLSMQLAESHGISANIQFPLPAAFVWDILRRTLPDVPRSPAWSPERLQWEIYQLLPELEASARPPWLERYLARGPAATFRLARQLATLFDQYQVYRRDMVRGWNQGEAPDQPGGRFQAALWRQLGTRITQPHNAQIVDTVLQGERLNLQGVPDHILAFGLTALAPDYLAVLQQLAERRQIHLYLPLPSRHFLGDEPTRKQAQKSGAGMAVANDLVADLAGPLKAFYQNIFGELDRYDVSDPDQYARPGGAQASTVLQAAQRDIVDLTQPQADHGELPRDRSLAIHGCHNELREVEVLHNEILRYLKDDATLRPRDIVVMCPDLPRYAPFIRGVFSGVAGVHGSTSLPFTLADQTSLDALPVVHGFLEFASYASHRITASQVLGLLDITAVATALGLEMVDVENIRRWVVRSGVRWALSPRHRQQLTGENFPEFSWQFGLDRLLLGYALGPELNGDGSLDLVQGIAPLADIEGSAAQALGGLSRLLESLREHVLFCQQQHSLDQWRHHYQQIRTHLFGDRHDDPLEQQALALVDGAIGALRVPPGASVPTVDWQVIRDALSDHLAAPLARQRFPGTGINFCAPVPLRNLPFRMVAMIGMHFDAFPRKVDRSPLNLIALRPKSGDRNPRLDDKLLFLQSLIAARDVFYLSYISRGARDDKLREPSVMVSQLREFVERRYLSGNQQLLTQHALQPFGRNGWEGDRVRFDAGWRPEPVTSRTVPEPRIRIAPDPLAIQAEPGDVCLDVLELQRFFVNPIKHFAHHQLRIRLDEGGVKLDDDEPLALGGLEYFELKRGALDMLLSDQPGMTLPLLQSRGLTPPGTLGSTVGEAARRELRALHELLDRRPAPERVPVRVETQAGCIEDELLAYAGCVETARPASSKAKDQLRTWITHLVMCASGHGTARHLGLGDCDEQGVGRVNAITFEAVAPGRAREELNHLLQWYQRGQNTPLAFMPELASNVVLRDRQRQKGKKPIDLEKEMFGSNRRADQYVEGNDEYVALAVAAEDRLMYKALGEQSPFLVTARAIWRPLTEFLRVEDAA